MTATVSHWCVEGFLRDERQALLDFVLAQESAFRTATVNLGSTRAVIEGVRRAKILDDLGRFKDPFLARLRLLLPEAQAQLGQREFDPDRIELQVTASNDGDYFRLHQDGGPDDTREITFVYFLHSEPRRFTGGELRVLSDIVIPAGDRLVFFPSISVHEVLPLHVPASAFADSRFTVNGWIHRRA